MLPASNRFPQQLNDLGSSIENGEIKDIEIVPSEGDTDTVKTFAIAGPSDSPYEGYWFRVVIQRDKKHPYYPPKIKMKDRIWGLFFDENTGEVCIDILNTEWSPIYTLTKILQSLISLLSETKINLEESTFLNAQAAILKQNNERQFNEEVRKFCEKNHYKKQQIYSDVDRQAPRQIAIQAEGDALNSILQAEKNEQTLKKRKLIYKEKIVKYKKKEKKRESESDEERPIP